jgi:hypothetical protein
MGRQTGVHKHMERWKERAICKGMTEGTFRNHWTFYLAAQSVRVEGRPAGPSAEPSMHITGTDRIHLVLSGMQNRTFGPYLAAPIRILISVMALRVACGLGTVLPAEHPHMSTRHSA